MKQTDFMNKIIDARCYFTSKCKISPRVIYFIQIISEQAESGWGCSGRQNILIRVLPSGALCNTFSPYAPPNLKRGITCICFPLRPDRILKTGRYMHIFSPTPNQIWKRGATCKYFSLRPSRSLGSEALHANIFSYAPVGSWAGNYMQNLSVTPRCSLKATYSI